DKNEEKQMMDEVVGTLSRLSREQMTEVLKRLDAAGKVADPNKSQKELDAAYARHREIVVSLKTLLGKYDAVKNLEQAAERLEKTAKMQLELHLHNRLMDQELDSPTRQVYQLQVRGRGPEPLGPRIQHLADEQSDLGRDVANLFKQLDAVKDRLP